MLTDDEFEIALSALRPKLHRYCARMVGSAVDGEDLVQEVLIRAIKAHAEDAQIDNLERWLLRVSHNASLDMLRKRSRVQFVPLEDDLPIAANVTPRPDVASVGFRAFLQLAPLQRCAVVLKDVLGHSVEEIAAIANCSIPAAKSALQRGRQRLKEIACRDPDNLLLPLLDEGLRIRLVGYVEAFRTGDFDTIRKMLSDEVSVDLVNRLKLSGRDRVSPYFTRYAEAKHWRYALGAVDGIPVMLVYDAANPAEKPMHFAIIDWKEDKIAGIRDFLFAPYVMDGADWVRLPP